ncbi:hypothetical protein GH714_015502 [Hevea brasiliensis]|uniref:C2 domain-containing protein n=1 Tax=Hevea brasiliensis TaxID=3981 RepID=A0A6A6N477_HEVBR|nr:hypothetical protein GH714_015502 [Hevea brasiliensis]
MYSLRATSEEGSTGATDAVSSATAKNLFGTLGFKTICKCVSLGKLLEGVIGLRIWKVGFDGLPWDSPLAPHGIANTRPKIYYSPRLWYVRVKVIEAQDLVPSDRTRNPEVYVKVVLGNVVLRTKISSNKGANPSWNEELMFVAAEPFEDILVLSVEDKLGDKMEECLGKCVIPLHKLDRRLLPPPVAINGVYHVFDEPAQYSSDLKATSPKLKPEEIGLLELGILKAEGLVPMKSKDGFEATDAYCVAKYGQKWARTSTIVGSLAPKWHEQYKWEVYDPCTVITIGVFDNCNLLGGGGKRDSIIGKVRIRLSTLETDRIYAHSYPLLALRPDGMKKMGELQLVELSDKAYTPPNIDTKLSHVEDASSDDWDEEFDAFPSSKPGEIIRKRYDRLRSIAGRLTEIIGHLAAQLEGLYSLLTWRDPRATPMFVVFCLITGLVVYLVPFRWLLAAAGTYAMRPPRLRVTLPPIPQNFLRRMPAKDDSML